jgi:hypothetical protein
VKKESKEYEEFKERHSLGVHLPDSWIPASLLVLLGLLELLVLL